jgi:Rrf2 family protein
VHKAVDTIMKLTRRTRYALAALIDLAASRADGVLQAPQIARTHGISPKFLEFALRDLRRAGIVHSRQGRGGGFSLARSPEQITLGAVVRALGDTFDPTSCLGDRTDEQCPCLDRTSCALHLTMREMSTALTAVLDGISLADILQKTRVRRTLEIDAAATVEVDSSFLAVYDPGDRRVVTPTPAQSP